MYSSRIASVSTINGLITDLNFMCGMHGEDGVVVVGWVSESIHVYKV